MKKRNAYLSLLFILFASVLFGQNRNVQWRFGNRASLVFQANTPQVATVSNMVSVEGCASVADRVSGDLLFYSNGVSVWNAQDQVMPNGTGLLAGFNLSASQGVIIVPQPGSISRYYLFTVDEDLNNGSNGFRYSVVDMALQGGSGDVLQTEKNILLQSNTTERLTSCLNEDETAHWVLIHERNNNRFCAYIVNQNGIQPNPVVSAVGSVHSVFDVGENGNNTMGCMKISPDKRKLAVALPGSNQVELFDFDPCTGAITNPEIIPFIDGPYGLEFSPDSRKLYVSLYFNAGFNGAIYQVDLEAPALSPNLVGVSSSFNFQSVGSLQLGPDNRIYCSINSENWLSAITQPNNAGVACAFVDQFVNLGSSGLQALTGIFGLPQTVSDVSESTSITLPEPIGPDSLCLGDELSYSLDSLSPSLSAQWLLQLENVIDTTFNELSFTFVPPQEGIYTLRLQIQAACTFDTIFNEIVVSSCDSTITPCNLAVTNVFSPNGDQINDFFLQEPFCFFENYQLFIYNRWGTPVFQSNSPQIGWNGKLDNTGEALPDGTYFFVLQYLNSNQNSTLEKGTVLLMR